jgi:hypothetical protein
MPCFGAGLADWGIFTTMARKELKEQILLGKWTEEKLNELLNESSVISNSGSRIDFLSRKFLDIEYRESTLIGDVNTSEIFVINLEGVDCFTFLDYIEGMRISRSFSEFAGNLKRVRYRSGKVAYKSRNHFFTDWTEFNKDLIYDATEQVSAGKSRCLTRALNQKDDGTYYLPGIPTTERKISYIPVEAIDDAIIENLKTGDYAGIYSDKEGLDVSHTGIIIRKEKLVLLRHASSAKKNMKVVDEDFRKYIKDKPGVIVLRPLEGSGLKPDPSR